jgi:hypothetical protein
VLGVGAVRQWRLAALAAGLTSAALMVVVGCTSVTAGAPVADTNDAQSYRSWVVDSLSLSAASVSERESTSQKSATAEAVANACEVLSSTSVDAVTAINAYVNAAGKNNPADTAAKAQSAVDILNRGVDVITTSLSTPLLPQVADAFKAWVDATQAVSTAIGARYGQREFNAVVDKFNQANSAALDSCGGSH